MYCGEKNMLKDGEGNGRLVPTGKLEPALKVSFEISHKALHSESVGGRIGKQTAVVHFISCDDGRLIPAGDYDLLIGSEILRLRRTMSHPEWLVLSSNA